jgi:toxin FitB
VTPEAIVVDSSIWIEMLAEGANAGLCKKTLAAAKRVLVPTLVIFEVYQKIAKDVSEEDALAVVGELSRHEVVELDRHVALLAADLSLAHKLGMADSLVLAHARTAGATLVTLDNDFAQLASALVLRR